MMGMGMGWGLLFLALFTILAIALAVWLVSMLFPRSGRPPAGDQPSARQILDQRYARGEISREQYELMKQDISDK